MVTDKPFTSSMATASDETASLFSTSSSDSSLSKASYTYAYGSLKSDDDDDDSSEEEMSASKGGNAKDVPEGKSHKTIGMLGSVAIAVNSLAGPAILQLPFQYQQSGIIPTTLCLIAVCVLSSYCSLHMANTVSQVPGNQKFDKCVEFSDCFTIFWNKRAFVVTQVLFFLCATCLNVAAIVDTAEVVDSFFGFHYKTGGWNAQQAMSWQTWAHGPCSRKKVNNGLCDPFGNESEYGDYLLTVGYLITAAVFVPVCLMDLKENTAWQIFGFVLLCTLSVYFCHDFAGYKLSFHHVSLWGHQWSDMLGVILFNFALVMAIPSWLHEKKESVSVKKVVYGSTAIATILYVAVGILGAFAIPHVKVNMLEPMVSGAYGKGLQLSGSLFAFFIIGLDIPLFSVLCRYNLTHSGLCSERMANILVVWIPWSVSWLFYQGDAIGELLQWGGVLLTSTVAFLLPLYIALRAVITSDQDGSIRIYGRSTSRRQQLICLYTLLFVAAIAVVVAIGGQISADQDARNYMKEQAARLRMSANKKHTHHKHSNHRQKMEQTNTQPRGETDEYDIRSMDDDRVENYDPTRITPPSLQTDNDTHSNPTVPHFEPVHSHDTATATATATHTTAAYTATASILPMSTVLN